MFAMTVRVHTAKRTAPATSMTNMGAWRVAAGYTANSALLAAFAATVAACVSGAPCRGIVKR